MTEHLWGDPDHDWESLYAAVLWFPKQLRRWGRVCVHAKEKWGCLRLEYFYWGPSLFQLIFPGRLTSYPWWFYNFSFKYAQPLLNYSGIGYLIEHYQRLVFNVLTIMMVRKWPHIKDELIEDYDFQQLMYKITKKYLKYTDHWVSYKP